jgi:hypothetical protein
MNAHSRALRLLVSAIVLTVVPVASAQKQPKKLSPVATSTITEASIRGHMEFLASDAMNGRGSGTQDEWRTAEYIASNLRRWGLEPMGDNGGYVQKIETGRTTAVAPPVLVIGGAGALTFTHGQEMIVQSINKGSVKGPLFRYAFGTPVPDGAFVFVPDGVTPDPAALAKAAGMLVVETPQTRAQWAAAGARLPGVAAGGGRGGGAAPAPIIRIVLDKASHAALAGFDDGRTIDFRCPTQPGYTWNAAARITGSDPKQKDDVILLGAHLDHLGNRPSANGGDSIFNGADDDASGVTAVLELAEALSKSPRPKRTIVFGLFGSEEAGGFGANYFVTKPVIPLDHIKAMLQFEMLGRPDPLIPADTLWLTGYERSNLGVELAKQGAALVQDPHPDQSFFTRSDNIRFAYEGVISHTVSSFNLHKDYHQASDEVGTIDFPYMTKSIQSMYAPVVWLSNSTFVPTWYENCRPVRGQGGRGGRGAAAAPGATPAPVCKANGK